MKADLHGHVITWDGKDNREVGRYFNKVIDIAAGRLGEGGIISVVNFFGERYEYFVGAEGYRRKFVSIDKRGMHVPEKDIYVVRGQEVPTLQGHLLALATPYGSKIEGGRGMAETLEDIEKFGGISVLVHPFYFNGAGPYVNSCRKLLKKVDAIEVYNGEVVCSLANRKARKFYEEVSREHAHLGALSSSDGHSVGEVGMSWTQICFPDKSFFVESLRGSIRGANLSTPMKKKNSFLGATGHVSKLLVRKLRI